MGVYSLIWLGVGSSDADSLESVQLRTRVRSVLNYPFWGWVRSCWVLVGLGPKLKTVIAQLRLSHSLKLAISNLPVQDHLERRKNPFQMDGFNGSTAS